MLARTLPLALLCSVTIPVAAQAQTTPDTATEDSADDIIVTALPPPVAASVYGTETLDDASLHTTASGRLEEALARIPGFQQFRRSDGRSANLSAQGVTLRAIGGNATSRTLILRDGVPIADAFFGYIPFSALPASEIGRVTVTRGSGTGPFGAGAIAGVVAMDSIPLGERAPIDLSVTGGSRNAWRGDAAVVLPLGSGHIAIDLHHDRGDGFQTTPADQRVAATVPARYRSSAGSIAAEVPVSTDIALQARVSLFRDDRTLRFAGADNGGEGADATLRLIGHGRWSWEVLGWLQARDFSSIVVSSTSFRPTLNQRATPTTGWGAKAELRPPMPVNQTLRFGVDLRGAEGEAIEDVLAANGARTNTRRAGGDTQIAGAWSEYDLRSGPFSLSAGARVDHWRISNGQLTEAPVAGALTITPYPDRSGTIGSFRGGVAFHPGAGVTVRASGYTGFRLPTLNELYRGFTVFPVVTRANANLRPERLRGFETAVEWVPVTGVQFTLTGFDNRLKDAVGNVTIGTNLRERRNIAAIRARGVEAALRLASGAWQFDTGWAYSNARVRAGDDPDSIALAGLRPAQSPVWSGSAQLRWAAPWGGNVTGAMRHVGMQFEDDRNIDRLPAATTFDIMVEQPLLRGFAVNVALENLANARVETRNSGGSIDLGAPRTFWLGLRWRP